MQETTLIEKTGFPKIIEQPVLWGNHGRIRPADRYKAIVDFNTGKLFSIVSRDYKLIRHEEAIDEVEKAIDKTPEMGNFQVMTEFFNEGGRMRRTYRFSEKSIEVTKGDEVKPELHLFNSYDVTWPFMVLLGAFRFVCENGLVVGKKFFQIRRRHVFDLEPIHLEKEVSTALKRFNSQTEQWKRWANRRLTEKTYNRVMEGMRFGMHATEEIENRVAQEADGCNAYGIPIISVWIFFNILTWYITHKAVSLNHRVEMEKRLRATMVHFKRG